MKIEEQFNLVAKEYDEGRRLFIPCFDDFYIGVTDFIILGSFVSPIGKPISICPLYAISNIISKTLTSNPIA